MNIIFGIIAAAILVLAGSSTAYEARFVTIPKQRPVLPVKASWSGEWPAWKTGISVPVAMAAGESEGVLVLVASEGDAATIVEFADRPDTDVRLTVFRAGGVKLKGESSLVPDPLFPVTAGDTLNTEINELFYLKLTTLSTAQPGSLELRVVFKDAGDGRGAAVSLEVRVLPIRLPEETPVTIQGAIWPMDELLGDLHKKDKAYRRDKTRELLDLLANYRFNAVAGMWFGDTDEYYELARYALDDLGFRWVRLPLNKMYNWKSPMSETFGLTPADEERFVRETSSHLARFEKIVENPHWKGRLGVKVWDEPRPRDYPHVAMSYGAVGKAFPQLRRELSEEPHPEFEAAVDVWVPYIKYLKTDDIKAQHLLGKEVWFYANRVHGIDHPLHGMRILGWLIWAHDLDGYHFWAINWWKQDPWTTTSQWKNDFIRNGTLVYPDPVTGRVYASLRLEAFRDGIEDMILLRELDKRARNGDVSAAVTADRLRAIYPLAERYDRSPDPAEFRDQLLEALLLSNESDKWPNKSK